MDYALRPPEVNSGLMYTGPGAGPLLAAAAAWDAVGAQLETAAAGYAAEIAGLGARWLGPSALHMAAAAAPYIAWLHASAAQAAQTSAQAYAAAAAYEAAFAMTVPPPVIAANRARLMALIATNFFGQNTPAIAATEAEYAEMWIQDATAMYAYAADSEIASTLKPFDRSPQTTSPDQPVDQANAVAQASANAAQQASSSIDYQSIAGPITYGPGFYVIGPDDYLTIDSGGSLIIDTGGMLSVGPNLNISISGNVTISPFGFLSIAGTDSYYSTTTVTLNNLAIGPFSGVSVGFDGHLAFGPAATITNSFVIVGDYGSLTYTTPVTITNGTVTFGAGSTVGTGGGNYQILPGIFGTSPAGAVGPGAAPSSVTASGLGPVSPLLSSPGLAGTAAIQPQVDVGQLLGGLPSAAD